MANNKLGSFNRKLGEQILDYILETSINESEQYVKDSVIEFKKQPYTDLELYDFLNNIGQMPVGRMHIDGERVCVGDISGFTQVLCDLQRFYERPTA